ncbi:MAG: hypothetical protein KAG66_03110, partial [Methylococcales bacterium]|nr:hypothetical protein [Methylococcales bacterium]
SLHLVSLPIGAFFGLTAVIQLNDHCRCCHQTAIALATRVCIQRALTLIYPLFIALAHQAKPIVW